MTSAETLAARLAAVVGTSQVWVGDERTAAFAIDTQQPTVVVCPDSVEHAAEIVTLAGRDRLSVVPWGQGTQMHLGKAPERYDIALSLAGLTRVIEYDVANLTVLAEAGTPLREIYQVSIPERQFLPLGFPGTNASLGGLLVTNTSGVKRTRYGALRDLILGVRVALPDGSLVRFGGRVMKNVAGYDMNKLFVGSLGAFGVVLETIYRLAALPEDDRALAVIFPSLAQATAAAAAVQASQLGPSATMLLSAEAVANCAALSQFAVAVPQVMLVLNFDGTYEAVERQIRDSRTLCQRHTMQDEHLLTGEHLLKFWEFQEAWRAAPREADHARLQLRVGTLPSRLEATMQHLIAAQTASQPGVRWLADFSSGLIFAHVPLPRHNSAGMQVQEWLQQLRTHVRHASGYCVVEYAPLALRQSLDVWGDSPGQQLLRRYKQHFDPHAVLNPGRYVAGL
jgi:glycolate oxidase FAD binding subunit